MPLLQVTHLKKSYGERVAVDDLSFEVDTGEVFGLLGPNGAGKSTTMMMIAGLLRADAGSITLAGDSLTTLQNRMQLGVAPQDLAIYPDLTANENLAFFGQLYSLTGPHLQSRMATVLQQVGLTERANHRVATFSGGMKRRLNFAVAILHEPQLLILDEPTVGVDPQSRAHLLECIKQLKQAGMAVIYASHYMEEVQAICQRVGIIDRGKMLLCDTLTNMLNQLETDFCLSFANPSDQFVSELKRIADHVQSHGHSATVRISHNGHQTNIDPHDRFQQLLKLAQSHDAPITAIETHEPNLERLFLQLTGHQLRD